MINSELNLISEARNLLKGIGNIEIIYATAELAPFSNQQKPDLVVYPKNASNKALFVEYKIAPENGFKDTFWTAFEEKKHFVEESSEVNIIYIFSTNINLSDNIKLELRNQGVDVIDEAIDAETLSSKIKNYANGI